MDINYEAQEEQAYLFLQNIDLDNEDELQSVIEMLCGVTVDSAREKASLIGLPGIVFESIYTKGDYLSLMSTSLIFLEYMSIDELQLPLFFGKSGDGIVVSLEQSGLYGIKKFFVEPMSSELLSEAMSQLRYESNTFYVEKNVLYRFFELYDLSGFMEMAFSDLVFECRAGEAILNDFSLDIEASEMLMTVCGEDLLRDMLKESRLDNTSCKIIYKACKGVAE